MPRQPVQGAAVAPHHAGPVVGVDLGEQRPPRLLGRHPGVMRSRLPSAAMATSHSTGPWTGSGYPPT
jgi:hypothetical protein